MSIARHLLAVACLPFLLAVCGAAADPPHDKAVITVTYSGDSQGSHTVTADMHQNYTLVQEYVWNDSASGRFVLTSYQIDGGPDIPTTMQRDKNFTLDITTNSDHSVVFHTRHQFEITSTEDNMTFIPPSPTGDNWFDKDSDIEFSVPYVIPTGDQSRRQFFGWTLDSPDITIIPRQESGFFKSPPIHMSESHSVVPEYKNQYHVSVISNFGRTLGTGWYDSGAIADISVIPGDDLVVKHVFAGWQGQVIGSSMQYSANIVVDSPKVLVANWYVDYTSLSVIAIAIISAAVLLAIYQKRKIPARR